MIHITRLTTNARRGRCVIFNGMVFLGGQVADDRSEDIRGQTAQALAKVDRFLADAGTDKSRLLTAQIWLKDIARDFAGMNEVWDSWIASGEAPARATAQCELGAPGGLIEIVVTAAVAASRDRNAQPAKFRRAPDDALPPSRYKTSKYDPRFSVFDPNRCVFPVSAYAKDCAKLGDSHGEVAKTPWSRLGHASLQHGLCVRNGTGASCRRRRTGDSAFERAAG